MPKKQSCYNILWIEIIFEYKIEIKPIVLDYNILGENCWNEIPIIKKMKK